MQEKTLPTATARLYLSGPVEVAKQIIRAECLREGLCVTVEPSTFIYTGGEESGYVVGLVDYPRFPWGQDKLTARARDLMRKLLDGTHQHSALMVTPELTEWITKREPDIAGVTPSDATDEDELAPEHLRMADALDEIAKPLARGSACIVRRAAEMLRTRGVQEVPRG